MSDSGVSPHLRNIEAEPVIVRPALIDDVLVNPHMGPTTFQRFNGDPLNDGQRWSEFGPEDFSHAGEPPADSWPAVERFPQTSIAYCRWYWGTINPEPDVIRFDIIENACDSAAARGQTLDLRIMPHNASKTVPEWYRKGVGRGEIIKAYVKSGGWLPDYEDPAYLEHFGKVIREVGARYDGDPRINMVDLAMFGHWGEWHRKDGKMGPEAIWLKGIDLFLEAWPKTPKAMLIAETRRLGYACDRGCGWRLDCWGDMGGFGGNWNHMLDFYNQALARTGTQEAWKSGPVSLEVCWVMGKWHDEGWDIDYIIDQAIRWHATSINLKSSPVPDDHWPHLKHLMRNLGYRICLRRIQYPSRVAAGGSIEVQASWENRGIAPPYHGYPAALQLKGEAGEHVIELAASSVDWQPGWVQIEKDLPLPEGVAPGEYRVRVALLSPHTRRPIVRLGNEGHSEDGWCEVGSIEVVA